MTVLAFLVGGLVFLAVARLFGPTLATLLAAAMFGVEVAGVLLADAVGRARRRRDLAVFRRRWSRWQVTDLWAAQRRLRG